MCSVSGFQEFVVPAIGILVISLGIRCTPILGEYPSEFNIGCILLKGSSE